MIISIEELRSVYKDYDFSKYTDERLKRKLLAIEGAIRTHTNNNFINRNTKIQCCSHDGHIYGDFKYFNVGDTIEIYNSKVNDGLYTIEEKANESEIVVDRALYECDSMMIVKVEYPLDVIDGCVELLDYDCNQRSKLKAKKGIASESISRHSVSYVQSNSANTVKGYPIELLSFLEPYVRWRT